MNAKDVLDSMSPHLRLPDLPHTGRIVAVEQQSFRNRHTGVTERRPVATLDTGRTLILERLRLRALIAQLGDETDAWIGALVTVDVGKYKNRPAKIVWVVREDAETETGVSNSNQYQKEGQEQEQTQAQTQAQTQRQEDQEYEPSGYPPEWDTV